MQKLIDFWRQKYKILIPVMVVFVLLVAVYFLYKEYKYDNYRNRQETLVFQTFGGIKTKYTAIITYNLKDIIVDITAKDKQIEYDSTPIYYQKEDKVIFPSEMSLVKPLEEGSQFKLYKYSVYEYDKEKHMIHFGADSDKYSSFFLFDGKKVFFFPDEVTLYMNGVEFKKLGGMSYVKIVGGNTLEYYDKTSDTTDIIEIDGKKITAKGDEVEVGLSERYVMSFGKKVLLVSPDNLNAVNN